MIRVRELLEHDRELLVLGQVLRRLPERSRTDALPVARRDQCRDRAVDLRIPRVWLRPRAFGRRGGDGITGTGIGGGSSPARTMQSRTRPRGPSTANQGPTIMLALYLKPAMGRNGHPDRRRPATAATPGNTGPIRAGKVT